jgi:hypothetical protein
VIGVNETSSAVTNMATERSLWRSEDCWKMLITAKLVYINCGFDHCEQSFLLKWRWIIVVWTGKKLTPRVLLVWCSSTRFPAQLTAPDLARHFKTETTETVAFCFGIRYPKTPCLGVKCQLARWRGYWTIRATHLFCCSLKGQKRNNIFNLKIMTPTKS